MTRLNVLITGGAGFIGSNTAKRFLERGENVWILDNLSRHEALSANIAWLQGLDGRLASIHADVRDYDALRRLFSETRFDVVIHLAAQTAVTTSVTDPRLDFEINALGTFNLLEAVRESGTSPVFLYSSTNKVYGGLEDVSVVERNGRYEFEHLRDGVAEDRPLDFHSPYGCSKGAADQYVIDYSRIYGLRTVSLRQSCIYGTRQFGMEDQGWVAWFTIAAVLGRPIVIYGDGKQVRDILYVDDLVDLFEAAIANIDSCAGQAFNVGGGPRNVISLLELVGLLEQYGGRPLSYSFDDWRPGDQRAFVCDISKADAVLGWRPRVGPAAGIRTLYDWVVANRALFADYAGSLGQPALGRR